MRQPKNHWEEKLGDNPLLLSVRRRDFEARSKRAVLKVARELGQDMPPNQHAKAPGEPADLRGIPAIGRGVAGATAGSRPGAGRTLANWSPPKRERRIEAA